MAKIFILAGVPGCGKTTWAKQVLENPGSVWVSSDHIRQNLFGDEYNHDNNPVVFSHWYKAIDDALLGGWDVIADATNLDAKARDKLRAIGEIHGVDVHLILFTNVDQAVRRNAARTGSANGEKCVPQDAMEWMLEKYERTRHDLPQEPYTSVTYIGSVE